MLDRAQVAHYNCNSDLKGVGVVKENTELKSDRILT